MRLLGPRHQQLVDRPVGPVDRRRRIAPTVGVPCGCAASRPARTPRRADRRCSAETAAGSCRAVVLQVLHRLEVARREAEFGRLALVADDRHRQPPALTRFADHVLGRHARAVEGHLAELGGDAVDHLQRSLLDARLVHRHGERGQALVLRDVGIGAGQHDAPLGDVGVARPDLVPVDDVLVAVERRRRAQRREVGPGVGLAETLAPPVAAVDEAGQEPVLDRLAAVVADALDQVAEARLRRRAGAGQLLVDDHLVHRWELAAAVLRRPGRARRSPASYSRWCQSPSAVQ